MMHATIDYGSGLAEIWGEFDEQTAEDAFYQMAGDCFGIRKSILDYELTSITEVDEIPKPYGLLKGASRMLKHNCGGPGWIFEDIAVWNDHGEKIKSEWD